METQSSDMSFAVSNPATGFEYSSRGLGGFFAQPGNLFSPGHYRLLLEILRFNREAPKLLNNPDAANMTLGEMIEAGGYAEVFTERYLYPMAAAVWSMSTDGDSVVSSVDADPVFPEPRHAGDQHAPAVEGGARGKQELPGAHHGSVQGAHLTGVEIRSVARNEAGVELHFADRATMAFDEVVFSCHGNQILPLLETPTGAERSILENFKTSRNEVLLHTDSNVLPRRGAARASWNYSLSADPHAGATVTYHMNRLQSLDVAEDYCVTLNDNGRVDPSKVLRRLVYHHPLYTSDAVRAQARWSEISGQNHTHFCGAYWFYGFHEDGLNSALRVARGLGVEC